MKKRIVRAASLRLMPKLSVPTIPKVILDSYQHRLTKFREYLRKRIAADAKPEREDVEILSHSPVLIRNWN